MSTTDGDASSRLDGAIADVLSGAPVLPGDADITAETTVTASGDDWSVDGPDDEDETYTLPQIVPATTHPPSAHGPAGVVTPALVTSALVTPAAAPAAAVPTPATQPASSWTDHMVPAPAGSGLRAPGRRPRVRRVTRVLRHIDPWSTFKVALLFSVVAYVVALTSGVLLWRVADSTGTLDNVERWFTQFGWETFELKGGEIFHNAWIIGLFGAVALTGGLVLMATLFNLVSDIVGGVRMTVLEEEVVERTVSSTRRYVVRRPPTGGADGEDWDVDDDPTSATHPAPRSAPSTDASAPASDDWNVDDEDGEVDAARVEAVDLESATENR